MKKINLIVLVFMWLSIAAFGQTTVVDIIVNSDAHTTLETAVIQAELNDDLSGDGPFTVFAPTDDAFAALPDGTLDALLQDPTGELANILLYHVVSGKALSTDLSNGQILTTLFGQDAKISISGDTVRINDAVVTMANIEADNGVVHVIDAVLLPPAQSVVDVIVNSEVHTTLETAVIQAELNDDLSGDGPFTVFAPTDDAFAALPDGTLDALLQDPTGELANILLYHVVSGKAYAGDLSNGQFVTTLLGQEVLVTINDEGVFIDDAQVTVTDIIANNGVVHVIDAVLLPTSNTVVDVIVNSEAHTTLETAVIQAELNDDLSGDGPFTVFAPTDDAFAALPDGTLDALLQDPTGDLANILLYHVVNGKTYSADLADGQMITTLQGKDVEVTINDDGVFINGAEVTIADLRASNGVVHVIDAVLTPPVTVVDIIVNSEAHTTLETAVVQAELDDDLSGEGPFTVFAPTDDAFAALPDGTLDALLQDPTGELANILLYHVVSGKALDSDLSNGQILTTLFGQDAKVIINDEGVFINDAQVTMTNLEADNGVVHVIDAVLLPPSGTVVDVIVNSEAHTTLETAVIQAELNDDLSGDGPFTVFAPTDDAFAALPDGTLDALLQDPTGDLANILLYHVVNGKAYAKDLSDGQFVTTLLGQEVLVTINDEGVFIDSAKVTVTDILATNGVVHVIDAVLLPASNTVVDVIVNSEVHTTLETAVIQAELNDDLSADGPFTVFAPTDDAFAALPDGTLDALLQDPTGELADILLYHVVDGKAYSSDLMDGSFVTTLLGQEVNVMVTDTGVLINNAKVTVANIRASNGVVHVIDAVLLPTNNTVVDIIVNSEDHTTLETAVIQAELDDDLSGAGPFTVFAPTDDAFAALPDGTLDALLQDPTGELANILLYHVVEAEIYSTDLSNGQGATTLFGEDVVVTINDEGVFINDAQVTVTNIPATNGVVHVIDAVLLPPANTVVEIVVNSEDHTLLETAVIAAGLDDDLSGDGPFTLFAPTDAAFNNLPDGVLEGLLAAGSEQDLINILLYHVVSGKAYSGDLSDGQSIETNLSGQNVNVSITDQGVLINNALVTAANILATNGVVHVIDAVLLPPTVSTKDAIRLAQTIELFPNPTSDYFRVTSSQNQPNEIEVRILNLNGQVMRQWNNASFNQTFEVNTLPIGTYIVEMNVAGTRVGKPLIIKN